MSQHVKFDGIIISNRGNISGRQPELENKLTYLQDALKAGWHVCLDVVFHCGNFILPRDGKYDVAPPAFLSRQRVWCRAHDPETLDALCNISAHAFLISDSPTLTSSQFVWTPPDGILTARSIAGFPEQGAPSWLVQYEPAGLCSDVPANYV